VQSSACVERSRRLKASTPRFASSMFSRDIGLACRTGKLCGHRTPVWGTGAQQPPAALADFGLRLLAGWIAAGLAYCDLSINAVSSISTREVCLQRELLVPTDEPRRLANLRARSEHRSRVRPRAVAASGLCRVEGLICATDQLNGR
jgi:hypothetical protein